MPDCENTVFGKGRHGPRKFCDDCNSKRFSFVAQHKEEYVSCSKCGIRFLPHSSAPRTGNTAVKKCVDCR